jgi:hypothetical protein
VNITWEPRTYGVIGFNYVESKVGDSSNRVCFGEKLEVVDSPLLFVVFPSKISSIVRVARSPPARKLLAI